MFAVPFLASVCLLLAGCSTTAVRRGFYLDQLQLGSLTNVVAFRDGERLAMRFPLRGRDVFARAQWEAPAAVGIARQQTVALQLDKEGRASARQTGRRGHALALRGTAQWEELVAALLPELVPPGTNEGRVLLVHNVESALFRDARGTVQLVALERKPPEVAFNRTLGQEDVARRMMAVLEQRLARLGETNREVLFATGRDPAFVLFDLDERLVVFFSHPLLPEIHGETAPADFPLRAVRALLWRSGVVGAIKNPVTTLNRGLWTIWNSGAALLETAPAGAGPPPPLHDGPGMNLAEWERDLDGLVSNRRHRGSIRFLIDGEQFFPAFIEAVGGARRSVDVQTFIFDNDDYAVRLADLLKQRSIEIRVRVLFDEMGSLFASRTPPPSPMPAGFEPPSSIRDYLEQGSRVEVRRTANPWLTIDHRKLIVVDGQRAFLGGMNLGREYRHDWHDLMVELRGPVLGRLEKDFRQTWAHAGWTGDLGYARVAWFAPERRPPEPPGCIDLRPLYTATGERGVLRAQLEAMRRARRYIYLENAYLSQDAILDALIKARRRGVDVRVIFPAKNDSGFMSASNLIMANLLVREGVRVFAYPGMSHVKAAIYDGWACLGSANFDKMSLRVGQELNLGFSDPATVERLRVDLFEADFAKSREITEPLPVDWTDYVVEALANQL
jgi:cardiolipin synthase